MGRKTNYRPEMVEKIYQYIDERRNNLEENRSRIKYFKGEACPQDYTIGSRMPTIWDLGDQLGVRTTKIYEWEKKFPELSEALKEYRELQKYFLIQNTLRGFYKEYFAIFVMKNITDWSDTPKVKIDPKSLSDEELVRYAKIALSLMGGEQDGSKG